MEPEEGARTVSCRRLKPIAAGDFFLPPSDTFLDAFLHIGEEWIGAHSRPRIQTHDQSTTFASGDHRTEVDAEILARIRRQSMKAQTCARYWGTSALMLVHPDSPRPVCHRCRMTATSRWRMVLASIPIGAHQPRSHRTTKPISASIGERVTGCSALTLG